RVLARLAALERQLRLLRASTAASLLILVILAASWSLSAQGAPASPTRIKAPFEVTDAAGKVALRGNPDGIVDIGDPAQGAGLLGVGASGNGFVLVKDAAGKDGIALGARDKSGMGVRMLDQNAQVMAALALDSKGEGNLEVVGPTRVAVGTFQNGPMGVRVL